MRVTKWNKENVIAFASKCKTKKEFREKYNAAYLISLRRGWKDEVLKNLKGELTYWDFESCKREAKKYKTKAEFRKKSSGAYNCALRHNFLEKICAGMKSRRENWTKKKVIEAAKACVHVGIFIKKYNAAFNAAKRDGYLDEVYSYLKSKLKNWTKSNCLSEIEKYEYKTDFMKQSPGAYAACKKNSWHLDAISKLKVKLNRHWTKEEIKALASKCQSRKEFNLKHKGAYLFALRRGWKEEVLKDLPISFKYWNFNSCWEEAKKYSTKKAFRENCGSAYAHASESKFLDKICGHMEVLGNEYKRMIYAYEFPDNHVYVGLTYNEGKRKYEHSYEKRGPVYKHVERTGLQPVYVKLHDFVSKERAAKLEDRFIKKYRAEGWITLNGVKGGALGGNERYWTFEKCQEIALGYNRKEDLRWAPGLGGLYNAARKNGWWDQICSHMTGGNRKWTKEKVIEAVRKCKYVGEFQNKYGAAYRAAKEGNYLPQVQSLLKKKLNYWDIETVFIEAQKYKTIAEFQRGCSGAYQYARRNGLIDKIRKLFKTQ